MVSFLIVILVYDTTENVCFYIPDYHNTESSSGGFPDKTENTNSRYMNSSPSIIRIMLRLDELIWYLK
jgi:hypothetical protein